MLLMIVVFLVSVFVFAFAFVLVVLTVVAVAVVYLRVSLVALPGQQVREALRRGKRRGVRDQRVERAPRTLACAAESRPASGESTPDPCLCS